MKRAKPALITDADRSQDDQLHAREVRYLLMMAVRVACLVTAAVLVGTRAPLLWLWIPICVAGMVLIPWLAVLLANDRPPKDRYRLRHRPPTPTGPPQLPPAAPVPAGPSTDMPMRVIEHED